MASNNVYEERLGTEKMAPLIFSMALPSIAAQLVNLLYGIVDRAFIGHIPVIGKDALAGVGVTNSIIILISAFSSIVSGGGAPLASMSLGRGEREKAERFLGNGFVLLIIFAVLTSAVTYTFIEPLLMLVGASEVTLPYASGYLRIYLLGTLSVQLATGLNTFISAQGRPGIAMISVITGAAVNTVLDPILIFGLNLGVEGAAIATVIAQTCSAVWVVAFLFGKHASLRIKKAAMKPSPTILGRMFGLGISPFVMSSTESLVGFVLNGSLKVYGDIYVSALTIMQSSVHLFTVPLSGFSQGFVPVVSYNYGHGDAKRVKEALRVVMPVMVLFNFVMAIAMVLFPSVPARIFTDDPELIDVVCRMMPLFLTGMTIFGLQRTCQNMFVSMGQAKISLFIALLRKVILLVPLALILPHLFGLGVNGVFLAESIADALAATCCTVIFALRFPKLMKAIKPAENGKKTAD